MLRPQGIPGVTYNMQGGYFSIDAGCAGVDMLPNISFAINGNVYALPPWQWTQAVRARSGCVSSCKVEVRNGCS